MARFELFSKGSPEERFWEWFLQNRPQIRAVKTGTEPVIGQIAKRLASVHKDLVWVAGKGSDGVHEFIISADGIREMIPKVKSLVDAAPDMAGWRIIAFRPREPGLGVKMANRELTSDSIFFVSAVNGEKLDIDLYIDGLNASNFRDLAQCCFILLDSTIGEYDVMTRIGEIDFKPLIEADGRQRPLTQLAEEVDALKASQPGS